MPSDIRVDFASVMERMRRMRARVSRRVSADRLRSTGIDVFFGAGRFADADAIEVDGNGFASSAR